MHVRLWAALSGAVLFTLLLATGALLWLCLPFVWGHGDLPFVNSWCFRACTAVLCLTTGGYALALARIALTLFPMPRGHAVARIEAPKLWSEVDRVAAGLGAPRVHHIILDERLGAAICSRRSWLLFSWRHCLVLGLPLLRALPPEEMRAVIAHELAHLRRGDTILNRSVYRAHALWGTLDHFATRRPAGLLERMIRRAAHRGRVVSRRHRLSSERAADAACLRVVSSSVTARALVRSFLAQRQVAEATRDWKRVSQRRGSAVPDDFVERVDGFLERVDARAPAWLAEEMCGITLPSDDHPCLRERVRALTGHADAAMPAPIEERESAASAWIGALRWQIARSLSTAWRRREGVHWKLACVRQAAWRERAEDLQQRLADLDAAELRLLATLRQALHEEDELKPVLKRLMQFEPGNGEVQMRLGHLMLESGSLEEELTARGLLQRASESHPDLEAGCLMILAAWHARCGRAGPARSAFERVAAISRRTLHGASERGGS